MTGFICSTILFMTALLIIRATRDVREMELRFLADHLNDHECRQLIEALHSTAYQLSVVPDGSHTEANRTCLELLEKWNQVESRGESFVRLVERLRQIGQPDLAETVSRAVLKDVSNDARLTLHDPSLSATDDVIVLHNPAPSSQPDAAHIPDFDGRSPESTWTFQLPAWTLAQTVLFIISSTVTIGLFGYWFFYCVPECMRGLWGVVRRQPQRSRDDAAQLLLQEMDDADL
ncbi:uncharacterized protein LOC129601605 [Paramacrobiotus metropolitanus]|uniref:uncharacterized protein LOC129601605 n=1 Tax=Paramacrobiotus metropolitanus TaxID=2943436 RepID=UPI0024465448|nr:uncharacterized protein LOC129601605 [Paramacrobiotus metropolitanus]XP_055356431.1 uncharacterized protein LOC129601605 [Paramacrobiotus metropolitanus]XP_055356432.1 uncharacterized protein LOC129601605 [Paramacrobiotus metropolitanus]